MSFLLLEKIQDWHPQKERLRIWKFMHQVARNFSTELKRKKYQKLMTVTVLPLQSRETVTKLAD